MSFFLLSTIFNKTAEKILSSRPSTSYFYLLFFGVFILNGTNIFGAANDRRDNAKKHAHYTQGNKT